MPIWPAATLAVGAVALAAIIWRQQRKAAASPKAAMQAARRANVPDLTERRFDPELIPARPPVSTALVSPQKERMFTGVTSGLPGERAPMLNVANVTESPRGDISPTSRRYPGALSDDDVGSDATGPVELSSDSSGTGELTSIDPGSEDPSARGHRDRVRGENAAAPDGNSFDLSRTAAPFAAPPCRDDEANDDELDFDERNTYQARSRNDATRVASGTMRRLCEMDKYLREEVEEAQDTPWWGRHEV